MRLSRAEKKHIREIGSQRVYSSLLIRHELRKRGFENVSDFARNIKICLNDVYATIRGRKNNRRVLDALHNIGIDAALLHDPRNTWKSLGEMRAEAAYIIVHEMVKRGYTMSRLARELGISNVSVSKVINGATHNPRVLDALHDIGIDAALLHDPRTFLPNGEQAKRGENG